MKRALIGVRVGIAFMLAGCGHQRALGVRVFQDVEHVATLDVEDDVLEPDAAIRLELRVLRVVPGDAWSPGQAHAR